MDNLERVFAYRFGDIYNLYLAKVERKGKSQQQLDDVLCWLSGHSVESLHEVAESEANLRDFFASVPQLNEHAALITGVVCGVRVEDVEDPLMREIRRMDKVVDELARGKNIERIKRVPKK
ncbi:DUF2200 family protein [Corynebacterium liangguodongii]|uniref:DUF2200 domain-containing protein n=1 Tax=Corynebacterium liangguodongii TaxID=2079535 RepID=A0A2S0WD56_9CORY|nr:DUF2200 family protein [Corynebacterium liangguodongii]AWB83703.1 DUF2200 domain-containing protein [Corynebacterium liangguodongii]PWB99487.1 DUF2200 domain-containing protein [Corynebacterium liangguodongii]